MNTNKILVVDDEENILISLSSILEDEGYEVSLAQDAESALKVLEKEEFDVILLDIWLPQMDGLKLFEKLMSEKREEEVIFITGHGTIEQAVKAIKMGAFDFLEKPLSLERVIVAVKNAIKKKELVLKEKIFHEEIATDVEFIGESEKIRELKEKIKLIAPTDGRVLICGENGTGKELVARYIHRLSLRAKEPFIEVNCAAIPSELIESELFGHKKGAFTGAYENKKGKFLLANRGTLFLDEVGDMSLLTQAKVLRALEEQKIEPVGWGTSINVDVRVIAATNKNLENEIKEGRFREDLYYRLNVIRIDLPPLRERDGDILLIFKYYLDYFGKKYKKGHKTLTSAAEKVLLNYPWLGNVRELKNLAERIIILHQGSEIKEEDLMLYPSQKYEGISLKNKTLRDARLDFEREYIKKVLIENNYNISKSAEVLGIEKRHLYRKIAELKIK